MTWEPNDEERRTRDMRGSIERLPQREDVISLDAFRALHDDGTRNPEGDRPERDVVVLLIDRERDIWVCRDELTRELCFVTFTPEGDWFYVSIERPSDPDE